MDKALNIAHCVESYSPAKGGMPEVVRQLSERMVKHGHRVTVFTSTHAERTTDELHGVMIRSFEISGNKVEGIKGNTEAYFSALKDGSYDVIVFFAAQQWATDAVIDRLNEIPAKKIFVPTGFSHFHNPLYKEYYEGMKTWMRSFDRTVFLSDDYTDINFARANGITKNILIPNGAASEEFDREKDPRIRQKLGVSDNELLVLHVGTYTGVKGHREALNIFVRSSVKNATLVLVGDKIHYLEKAWHSHYSYFGLRLLQWFKRKKIVFAELNREDTVAVFKEADLFLFPSNVECSPIVLFESMAAGVPFLASDAGNTAEIIQWTSAGWLIPGEKTKNGWVKIDVTGSIAKFEQVVANVRSLRSAGEKGHAAWKAKFTWEIIAKRYLQLYHELTGHS